MSSMLVRVVVCRDGGACMIPNNLQQPLTSLLNLPWDSSNDNCRTDAEYFSPLSLGVFFTPRTERKTITLGPVSVSRWRLPIISHINHRANMDAVKTNPKRTAAGNHLHQENVNGLDDFVVPKVDMQKAASSRPSKLSGRNVAWLVTFVAGMGVS
jgi:hypothetical protein